MRGWEDGFIIPVHLQVTDRVIVCAIVDVASPMIVDVAFQASVAAAGLFVFLLIFEWFPGCRVRPFPGR